MESIFHNECVHLKFIKEKMPELELLLHCSRQLQTQDIMELINKTIGEKAKLEGKDTKISLQKGTGNKIELLTSYRSPAANQWIDSPVYEYPGISNCKMDTVDAKVTPELEKIVTKPKRKYKKREKKGENVHGKRADETTNIISKGKSAADKTSNLASKRKWTKKPTSSSIKKLKYDQVNF